MSEQATDRSAERRYGSVAILLHWVLALAMAVQLALGFAMSDDASGFAAYQLHKSIGIAILLLTLVRLLWRLFRRPPVPVEHGLGGLLARLVHWGFYAVLILGPLTGWALVSTAQVRVPTVLFGVVPWPRLPLPASAHGLGEEAHEWLAWLALGLIALHVAGALRHQLLLRDNLLVRMAPAGSVALVGVLTTAAAIAAAATLVLVGGGSGDRAVPAVLATGAPIAQVSATGTPTATPSAEPTDAVPPSWTVQPGGRLGFTVSNGGEPVHGTFARWSGEIAFDPDRPETAAIAISVDLANASVGDVSMDETLAGADFLAAAANPRANWRATAVRRVGPGRYAAQGVLTLKGVNRPQPLVFTLSGDGTRRKVEGSATIDRTAFGVGTGSAAENIAPQVSLEFAFDAVRQKD